MCVSSLASVFGSTSLHPSQSPTNCTVSFFCIQHRDSPPAITVTPEPTTLRVTHFAAVTLSQITTWPCNGDCAGSFCRIWRRAFSCYSVAGVLTVVETEQIRISIHEWNNKKNSKKSTNITKTGTHYKTQKYKHTLQNQPIHTPTHYKTHPYTQPHITKDRHTLKNPPIHTPTHYKTQKYKHTLQNPPIHTPTHYKTHTYTHPHITKHKNTNTHYKTHTYTHPHITNHTHTHTHTLKNTHILTPTH